MRYNIVRNCKDLPKMRKMSHRLRVMMKRNAAKYGNGNGGREYGKR